MNQVYLLNQAQALQANGETIVQFSVVIRRRSNVTG